MSVEPYPLSYPVRRIADRALSSSLDAAACLDAVLDALAVVPMDPYARQELVALCESLRCSLPSFPAPDVPLMQPALAAREGAGVSPA